MKTRHKSQSFTIIEMIMVIVIIGILAVIAANRFAATGRMKLSLAADRLVSNIRYAQNLATAYHENVAIEFSKDDDTYRVYNVDTGTNYKSPFTNEDFIVDFQAQGQLTGIDITDVDFNDTATLRFSSLGKPRDSAGNDLTVNGTVELSFQSYAETVEVHTQTGFCERQ